MPTISFRTVSSGEAFRALPDDADASGFQPESLTDWAFETRPRKTLTMIRAYDRLAEMNLKRGETGMYDPGAFRLAFALSYAKEHVTGWSRNGAAAALSGKELEEGIDDLPTAVLLEFDARANPGLRDEDVMAKKPEPPTD